MSIKRAKIASSCIAGIFCLLLACGFQLHAAPLMDPESASAALKKFSPERQKLLLALVLAPGFDGAIPADRVGQLLAAANTDSNHADSNHADSDHADSNHTDNIGKLMTDLLPLASHYALPPISDFRVGAVSQGASGALYLGANLEVAAGALAFAVHAEQSAVNNALLHGETGLRRIAVTAAPCGHCRQFLNELHLAEELEIIVIGRPAMTLAALLPQSFGPADLNVRDGVLSTSGFPLQCKLHRQNDTASCLGEQAARHSYAPYSHSPSAVVLKLEEAMFVGAYIENAAFNPSLPPLQSALDRMRFQHSDFSGIEKVLLFERPDAEISQENYTKAVLNEINPAIVLERVLVE